MRGGPWTALLTALIALAAAAPAEAENGYEARWLGQSDYLTLESGETANSWFDAQNIGTQVWTNDVVRLGTTNPRDRLSGFYHESWIGVGRPGPLDRAFVQPGQSGRFNFVVRAPNVSSTVVVDEFFAPLAEHRGWMENPGNWQPNGVFLRYTVLPAQSPTVGINYLPQRVSSGSPLFVRADAADNRRIDRVEFRLAGRAPQIERIAPYEVQIDTTGVPVGRQTLEITAVDGIGRTAKTSGTVDIDPVGNGAFASRAARMAAGFSRRREQPRVTVRYGRSTFVHGRLTNEAGVPITGATIQVASRVLTANRSFRELPSISTGLDGGFAYRAPRGPSRQIRLSYQAFAEDPAPSVVKLVRLKTRAGIRFDGNRRSVGRGEPVRFTGRLRGGRVPRRGVLVVLQGYQRGFGWRTFKTVRARRSRPFRGVYRFVRSSRSGSFRFRAVVREQAGYPFATGRSRSVRVRLR